ncbi:hypothetical protein KJ934_00245 [Patescibacteria group bacterium]|nr:hypothetical protein [Patescibacteria group bacterium]MBU4353197.1 hypothetical protein [Patescibacteria group bacterium]MCG2698978.1 hypothetical protein [Candidatus Parcubacteria bacterium]
MRKSVIIAMILLLVGCSLFPGADEQVSLQEVSKNPQKYLAKKFVFTDGVVLMTRAYQSVLGLTALYADVFIGILPFDDNNSGKKFETIQVISSIGVASGLRIGDKVIINGELNLCNFDGRLIYYIDVASRGIKKVGRVDIDDPKFMEIAESVTRF